MSRKVLRADYRGITHQIESSRKFLDDISEAQLVAEQKQSEVDVKFLRALQFLMEHDYEAFPSGAEEEFNRLHERKLTQLYDMLTSSYQEINGEYTRKVDALVEEDKKRILEDLPKGDARVF